MNAGASNSIIRSRHPGRDRYYAGKGKWTSKLDKAKRYASGTDALRALCGRECQGHSGQVIGEDSVNAEAME